MEAAVTHISISRRAMCVPFQVEPIRNKPHDPVKMLGTWRLHTKSENSTFMRQAIDPVTARPVVQQACNSCRVKKVSTGECHCHVRCKHNPSSLSQTCPRHMLRKIVSPN